MITRRELVERFAFARTVFSTFGGNPVAAQAALAVLDVIDDERLIAHAKRVGEALRAAARRAAAAASAIVDVRGLGLLAGVELDDARPSRRAVVDALRARGVLVGRTGPHEDVLKIRPPLVFGDEHAALLVRALDEALHAT